MTTTMPGEEKQSLTRSGLADFITLAVTVSKKQEGKDETKDDEMLRTDSDSSASSSRRSSVSSEADVEEHLVVGQRWFHCVGCDRHPPRACVGMPCGDCGSPVTERGVSARELARLEQRQARLDLNKHAPFRCCDSGIHRLWVCRKCRRETPFHFQWCDGCDSQLHTYKLAVCAHFKHDHTRAPMPHHCRTDYREACGTGRPSSYYTNTIPSAR